MIPWVLYHKQLDMALDILDEDPYRVHVCDQSWPIFITRFKQLGIDMRDPATQYVFYSGMQFLKEHTARMLTTLGADEYQVDSFVSNASAAQTEFACRLVTSWTPEERELATVPWPHSIDLMHESVLPEVDDEDEGDDDTGEVV